MYGKKSAGSIPALFLSLLTYVLCASNLYPAGIPFREIKPAAPVPGAKIRTSGPAKLRAKLEMEICLVNTVPEQYQKAG